jgi:hypothetical protein
LGSGSGFFGMSPLITGLRAGASGQSHSIIRSKNERTIRSRCRCVSAEIVPPRGCGVLASQTFKSSMSSRRTAATLSRPACPTSHHANCHSEFSATSTLVGALEHRDAL